MQAENKSWDSLSLDEQVHKLKELNAAITESGLTGITVEVIA